MDLMPFWIFSKEELDEINSARNANYVQLLESKKKELNQPDLEFDDRILERFYLKNLIKIVRSRKSSQANQEFFMTQKILQTTVYLFKRYYLVKHFINQDPHQIILCSLYLAMKLEEMVQGSIQRLAQKLKQKAYWRGLEPEPIHYYMNRYTELELNFLQTINFEVNKLSMVRPIQSLLNRIKSITTDVVKRLQIQKQVSKLIQNVYFSQMFWLVHPAKLALCIVLVTFESQKCKCDIQSIDRNGDIKNVINENRAEIECLMNDLKKLRPYNRKQNNEDERFERYRSWTKYFFQKPSLKRMNNSISMNMS